MEFRKRKFTENLIKKAYPLWMAFCLILFSCGGEDELLPSKTELPSKMSSYLYQENYCANEGQNQDLAGLIEEVRQEVTFFRNKYHFLRFKYPNQVEALSIGRLRRLINPSPLAPVVSSKTSLEQESRDLFVEGRQLFFAFEEMERALKENQVGLNGHGRIDFSTADPSAQEQLDALNEFEERMMALFNKVERFGSLSCSINMLGIRKSDDLRPLYEAEASQEISNELARRMCETSRSKASCEIELNLLEKKGQREKYISHYRKRLEDLRATFFQLERVPHWQCEKNEQREKEVIIPIKMDRTLLEKLGGNFSVLKNFVESRWSSSELKIKLVETEEDNESLKVEWINSGVSYVSDDFPKTIFLSKKIDHFNMLVVFTHELGHILGFPDCYHEFYDTNKDEVVYYTLDEKLENLMCSLNPRGTIPKNYFDQLNNALCAGQ